MNEYHVEGFVKTITRSVSELVFTIEPSSPYLLVLSKVASDAKSQQRLLLVKGKMKDLHKYDAMLSWVVKEDVSFQMMSVDFNALLVAKANHMKVRLTVSIEDEKNISTLPLLVNRFEVL